MYCKGKWTLKQDIFDLTVIRIFFRLELYAPEDDSDSDLSKHKIASRRTILIKFRYTACFWAMAGITDHDLVDAAKFIVIVDPTITALHAGKFKQETLLQD